MQLRPYQQAAVTAVYQYLREHDDNPVVVMPTASGKTPVLATICKDAVQTWNGRVLVLSHVKELLQQAVDKLKAICPNLPVGVYSAGLRKRDTEHAVIVAGIQSVFRKACELDVFDLIIVDECHLIPADGEGMYRKFLRDAKLLNPLVRVIGLTATPFRLDSGTICGPDNLLNAVCYEAAIKPLIADGYLCPLVTKAGATKVDTSKLRKQAGEFAAGDVEALMDTEQLVEAACKEIVDQTRDRRAVLIFAAGVKHGEHVVDVLKQKHGIECGFVTGETPASDRDDLLKRFKGERGDSLFGDREPLKYLCNVNVLTTGFDAPNIDCVVLLRPTMSAGLYSQMVGRGFRLHPAKKNCLVLDYGGNVLRHGPVDQLILQDKSKGTGEAPAKECPQCAALIAAGFRVCPQCGYEFPPPEKQKHDAKASQAGVLSGQVEDIEYDVIETGYFIHTKKDAGELATPTLRVDYRTSLKHWEMEWVCFEHSGYARAKAVKWWRERSRLPVPGTVHEAVELANAGALVETQKITVRHVAGERFSRVVAYVLGPIPELTNAQFASQFRDEEVPF